MEDNQLTDLLHQCPAVPEGEVFSLSKVERVYIPHPYCITPKHVAWASDHFSGVLGPEAIEDAEKHGAKCGSCKQGNTLSFLQHESEIALFITVPQNRDLNAVPGLHEYLQANKPRFEALGIKGFAFPAAKLGHKMRGMDNVTPAPEEGK